MIKLLSCTFLAIAALTAFSLVAIALFVWRAVDSGAIPAALFAAAVGAAGIWQLEPMVRLNRPRRFTPETMPQDLLP